MLAQWNLKSQVTMNYTKLCYLVLKYSGRFLVSVVQWTLYGFNQKVSTSSHSRWQNRLRPLYFSGRSGCPWTLWTLFGDAVLSCESDCSIRLYHLVQLGSYFYWVLFTMEKESQERLKISSPWHFAEGCDY